MQMNEVTFDPLDVRDRLNPFCAKTPRMFNAWEHIGRTVWLDPRRVKFMEGQPRESFVRISNLARSIAKSGQRTTILVHPITDPDYDVELTAGERRTRACREVGRMIRAEIRPVPANRRTHFVDAVIENFNREDLTLLETVKAVNRLVREGHCQADIAEMAGKTVSWVSQHVMLGTLDLRVLELLDTAVECVRNQSGRKLRRETILPMGLALQVAKLDVNDQFPFASMLIEENISLADARVLVRRRLKEFGKKTARGPRPGESFATIKREIQRIEAVVATCFEMGAAEFSNLAALQTDESRKILARRMRTLSREMLELAELVAPAINPSMWHPKLQEWLKKQGVTW